MLFPTKQVSDAYTQVDGLFRPRTLLLYLSRSSIQHGLTNDLTNEMKLGRSKAKARTHALHTQFREVSGHAHVAAAIVAKRHG